jgi:phi LC3 family holin
MLIDFILELRDSIDKHGIRWGVALTLYALFRKERRNTRLDQRDADIFHNQLILMTALGVDKQWRGQVTPYQSQEAKSYEKLLQLSQMGLSQVQLKRRVKKMQPNTNWITLIPALVGAIKLILQPFGIDLSHVTDQQVNDVVNGIAALATIIGILLPHKKGVVTSGTTTEYKGDSDHAV